MYLATWFKGMLIKIICRYAKICPNAQWSDASERNNKNLCEFV